MCTKKGCVVRAQGTLPIESRCWKSVQAQARIYMFFEGLHRGMRGGKRGVLAPCMREWDMFVNVTTEAGLSCLPLLLIFPRAS